jgi:hypothetical protein
MDSLSQLREREEGFDEDEKVSTLHICFSPADFGVVIFFN